MPKIAKLVTATAMAATITGCASTQDNAKSLVDRLEFGENEAGCVEIRATVDLNPVPMITSNASVIYKKSKPLPQQPAPEC
jgi:hypothetical protein